MRVTVDDAWLARLRAHWAPGARNISNASKLSEADRQWTLDFIAVTAEVQAKCPHSTLQEVRLLPLGEPVTDRTWTTVPTIFSETWDVDSCGRSMEWNVYDRRGELIVSPKETYAP